MKALGLTWALDDRQPNLVLCGCTFSLDGVAAAIGEDDSEPREPLFDFVAVLNAGALDGDDDRQAQHIGEQMIAPLGEASLPAFSRASISNAAEIRVQIPSCQNWRKKPADRRVRRKANRQQAPIKGQEAINPICVASMLDSLEVKVLYRA